MADTTFVNGTTLTDADWFNDVNRLHYTIFADAADAAAARTALGVAIGSNVQAYSAGLITNTGATTFLGANVTLNNTGTYFSGPNTGSIGGNGQVWMIIATGCAYDTAGATKMCLRIFDGSAPIADTESTTLSANAAVTITATAVVTLSAATTFTLQMKDALLTTGVMLTTGPNCAAANLATSITAIRLS